MEEQVLRMVFRAKASKLRGIDLNQKEVVCQPRKGKGNSRVRNNGRHI